MSAPNHKVVLTVYGDGDPAVIEDLMSYSITSDMLQFADSFSLTMPLRETLWNVCELDSRVSIFIDDSQVLDGFIDSRVAQGETLTVSGRDRSGRLLDEAAPFVKIGGKSVRIFLGDLVGDLFDSVRVENSRNRRMISGRNAKRTATREPAVFVGKESDYAIRPGEKKAAVIDRVAEEARALVWSSADGRELIFGKPNQLQDPSWQFAFGGPIGDQKDFNVTNRTYTEDLTDRYSQITVVGTGKGNRVNFGRNTNGRQGIARNGPGKLGTGKDFKRPKRDLIQYPRLRAGEGKDIAERLMAEADAGGSRLEVNMPGHGQSSAPGAPPAIFAFDTVASWVDYEIGVAGDFFVTRCRYQGSGDDSQTNLSMVPVGTELRGLG